MIPGPGKLPAEGNGYPLLYSCLENSMERQVWWATVYGVAESGMTEHLSMNNNGSLGSLHCVSQEELLFTLEIIEGSKFFSIVSS